MSRPNKYFKGDKVKLLCGHEGKIVSIENFDSNIWWYKVEGKKGIYSENEMKYVSRKS
jgi:hypothetical protein